MCKGILIRRVSYAGRIGKEEERIECKGMSRGGEGRERVLFSHSREKGGG